jgi:3-oxoacyl-[acyl-carrier protein] reductase
MDLGLKGKNAIVTGGSLGIGKAIALALGKEGVNVALNYRKHADEAEAVAARIRESGALAMAVRADVASFGDAESMTKQVVESFGGLDIVVCNAGVNRDGVIWKMTEEDWDTVMTINLKGYFNYVRNAAPIFKEQQHGKIVCVTSINGLRGKFGQSNYSASKAGIIGFVKSVARELGRSGVNCNAVAPGLIETDMVAQAPQKVKDMALAEIVLGRLGLPGEVADVVTFLCSDRSRHITGEVIRVDGGQYI